MPVKFCDRIKEETGDDYDKIQHVSVISVDRPLQFHLGKSTSLIYTAATFFAPVYKSL